LRNLACRAIVGDKIVGQDAETCADGVKMTEVIGQGGTALMIPVALVDMNDVNHDLEGTQNTNHDLGATKDVIRRMVEDLDDGIPTVGLHGISTRVHLCFIT